MIPTWLRITILAVGLLFGANCKAFVELVPPAKGSVENPVLCDMPAGQRRYLNLMRGKDGSEISYEYFDSVPGPKGRVLDRFLVENPLRKLDQRGVFAQLFDYLIADPVVPPYFRIYMDLYNPGVLDTEPVPGYVLQVDPKK